MLTYLQEIFLSTSKFTKAVAAFLALSVSHSLTPSVVGLIVALVVVDTILGVACAATKKKVTSKRFFKSLVKLTTYSLLMIVGGLVSDISVLAWISSTFLLLIACTELVSICENVSILEPRLLPVSLVKVLHLIKG